MFQVYPKIQCKNDKLKEKWVKRLKEKD